MCSKKRPSSNGRAFKKVKSSSANNSWIISDPPASDEQPTSPSNNSRVDHLSTAANDPNESSSSSSNPRVDELSIAANDPNQPIAASSNSVVDTSLVGISLERHQPVISDFNNGRGHWEMTKVFSILSFKNVPNSGVLSQPLPSDIEICLSLTAGMPATLKCLLNDPQQTYQERATDELAEYVWNSYGSNFMIKIPWEEVANWFAMLIGSSPAFHPINMNKYSKIRERFAAIFKRCPVRKRKMAEIVGGFPEDADANKARPQNWPCTEAIIKQIFEMLCYYGHPDKTEALADAVDIHFGNLSYTNLDR